MANQGISGLNKTYNFLFHPIASAKEGKDNKALRTIGSLAIAVFTLGSVHATVAVLKGGSWIASKVTHRESMSSAQKESADKTQEVGQNQLGSSGVVGRTDSDAQKLKTQPHPPSNYQAVDQAVDKDEPVFVEVDPRLSDASSDTPLSTDSIVDERLDSPPRAPSGYVPSTGNDASTKVENSSKMTLDEINKAIDRERKALEKREAVLDYDEVVINADPTVKAIQSRIANYLKMEPYEPPQEEVGNQNPLVSNPLDRVLSSKFEFKVADPQTQKGDDLKLHYRNFLNPIMTAADELLKLAEEAKSPSEIKSVEEKKERLEAKANDIWKKSQDAISDSKLTKKLNDNDKNVYLRMLTISYQTIKSDNYNDTVMNKLKEVERVLQNKNK